MPGTLYLVATPIGNLKDISHRALDTLSLVDLIACEDTRHTRKLLGFYRISNKLTSYHEHNEHERAEQLAELLIAGNSIAVVSDAGTPGICDPGFRVVLRAIEIGAEVVSVPGPAAFVSAAAASGLATDSLFFGGFLPAKKGERRKRLDEIRAVPATLVFYETPHRLARSLADCAEILGDRKAVIARELTKLHEEFVRGNLKELADNYSKTTVKGEIVLVIERDTNNAERSIISNTTLAERIAELEADGLEPKTALKKAAKEFGVSKSKAYRQTKVKK